jgi:hypothetical protein
MRCAALLWDPEQVEHRTSTDGQQPTGGSDIHWLARCDEPLHLARGPNFEFHARSIGPYLRDRRSRSGDIRERWHMRWDWLGEVGREE